MEVVGNEPALMYDSDGDAAIKIARTLADADEQQRLRRHLAAVSEHFSTAHFMSQVRDIVDRFQA
jgi:hypothetical protein